MTDTIEVPHPVVFCPNCQCSLKVRPKYIGQRVYCKDCGHAFRIPQYVRIPCPHCQRTLKIRPEDFEQPAGCKYCRHVFRARWAEPVAAPATTSVLSGVRPPVPHLDQTVLLERVRSLEVAVEQLLTQLAARTEIGRAHV